MSKTVEMKALRTQSGRGLKKGDTYEVLATEAAREEAHGRGARVESAAPKKSAPAPEKGDKA